MTEDRGRRAENLVFIELKRRGNDASSWKNGKGKVDFVIKEGLKPTSLIQVCWDITNEKTKKREIDNLIDAMHTFNLGQGLIITEEYSGEEIAGKKKIRFLPLWQWLLSDKIWRTP